MTLPRARAYRVCLGFADPYGKGTFAVYLLQSKIYIPLLGSKRRPSTFICISTIGTPVLAACIRRCASLSLSFTHNSRKTLVPRRPSISCLAFVPMDFSRAPFVPYYNTLLPISFNINVCLDKDNTVVPLLPLLDLDGGGIRDFFLGPPP